MLGYLVLLGLSALCRALWPFNAAASRDERILEIAVGAERVAFRFEEVAPASAPGANWVVLLGAEAFSEAERARWMETLGARFPVLAPKLPGGRGDAARYDSLAASSQAERVAALLDAKGVGRFHLVGIGAGGPVAVAVAETRRGRAASLALVSAPFAPELSLLGDYTLNQALRATQLSSLWAAENLAPHFGLLDRFGVEAKWARPGFETDLRETARALSRWSGPALFVGRAGTGRSAAAVGEAARALAPQAVVRAAPRDGFGAGGDVLDFVVAVESGRAASRPAGAAGEPDLRGQVRLNPWVAGGLLGLATFASEDLACIGGGLLAARGAVSLGAATLGALLGIFVGDFFIYLAGRVFGRSALEMPVLRRLASPEKLERCSRWFERRGIWLIVMTRFLPGSRVPTYFAAGVVGVGAARFAGALLVAAAVWTPLLVGAAYLLGDAVWDFLERLGGWAPVAALGIFLGLLVGSRLVLALCSWKGRRLLYGRWRRTARWEYWPAWALYPPVVLYILWLMARYRSATLPSAANPCMPASGLVYESKSQILSHLERCGAPVARYAVIPLDIDPPDKLARLEAFMSARGLGFPVVLKPDVGQRGQGVRIARSRADAEAFFANQAEDTIAQEYVPGAELGVFYCRMPGEARGWVFSVTEKRPTWVVGDGKQTLEELILRDPRAVCMARYFMAEHAAQLDRTLGEGERFALAELGTHCRGALFLDGQALATPEFEAAIDRFSARVEGFHYGRYDLRAPSLEAFARGEGIAIIELNGLTSESTNMYDPRHSVVFAWRTLMRQWRLAFEIAQKNRLAGHEPDRALSLARLFIAHLRGAPSRDLP